MVGLPPNDVNDLDSHEMIPTHFWGSTFGTAGAELAELLAPMMGMLGENTLARDDVQADVGAITPDVVWNEKGCGAPGAIDMSRRLRVLDEMGVRRQVIFPNFGLAGIALPYFLASASADRSMRETMIHAKGVDPSKFDARALAHRAVTAHNDWVLDALKVDPDRLRPVAMLATESLDDTMAEARRVIAGGARALWLPTCLPPAGRSPADVALDPFWSLAEQTDTAIVLHIGGEFDFMRTQTWREAQAFQVGLFRSLEFVQQVDIYTLATLHLSVSNYLTTMVLGGVFERHPKLRFGAIELSAHWVGPLMESLDMWVSVFPSLAKELSLAPSGYFRRNVRVTPFNFEPVDHYFERYPALVDVLVYSSDYPHVEGGRNSKQRFYDKVSRFGEHIVDKFFRTNGELLVPA